MNELQIARIMLMMYRQGWIDATKEFVAISNERVRILKKEYEELLEEKTDGV